MLHEMTPERYAERRFQFQARDDDDAGNVRAFVCHAIQNVIYKSGQLATLYFALGLDGTERYAAPFPNPIY